MTGSHPFGMGQMGSVAWPPTVGSLTSQPVAGAPIGSQVWQGMQMGLEVVEGPRVRSYFVDCQGTLATVLGLNSTWLRSLCLPVGVLAVFWVVGGVSGCVGMKSFAGVTGWGLYLEG